MDEEESVHGPDDELTELKTAIIGKVIPRLLSPLKIIPRLVHGDLWDGNASAEVNTGNPMIFDPLCLYAHN
ncbi:hypothetical protein BKA67DRAFT_524502 [Truncatella angustata]|uniref:Protein-ribulosamine 3-kinase n=1 Tax=Truncatella angustata TaxID=152316 RepID=A0A9P8RMT0_9PEZI|nr:uncharacterized protein BKA67DRAFT_524502 [Truncatella angustata]KAH6646876.1 hypothetical protein BKA67DRAFT_524502 [Truncatella angustata]